MITEAFDNQSEAIIEPAVNPNAPCVDACIMTFSHEIERHVLESYPCRKAGSFWFATGETPVYLLDWQGRTFAFFKTYVGAPACVGTVEDSFSVIRTQNYVVFGGAGCLDRKIAHGKVMIPTEAYRDEGTSYHYAPASDWIRIRNSARVARFMEESGIPHVQGRTWTTDSFYRETRNHFEKHREQGCISVEMECAALQAVCDFRQKNLYMFFTSGDLLDAEKWDERSLPGESEGTQHDTGHFRIALSLAWSIAGDGKKNV